MSAVKPFHFAKKLRDGIPVSRLDILACHLPRAVKARDQRQQSGRIAKFHFFIEAFFQLRWRHC